MTEIDVSDSESLPTVSVTIDGSVFKARPGELIIEAAERAGVFIPRFCYHPRMDSVGFCRMCLVEVSSPRGFSLQPSCFLHVAEGQEVITNSPKARKAQEGVLELLLVNHPLDCPVCDKGGECPLQDQAMAHGPGETRFIEQKRHWPKPIDIGPLVALDRERCIQCARCTRFASEVAGEALIDFAFRGSDIEVAPFALEPFSSYFAGNTVQICPVGALTAHPYRFKSRPWDLEQAESTCEGCAVGCRTVAQSSAGALVRYLGVDVDGVNRSWLCDKGRYGFEAVHASNRLVTPLLNSGEKLEESTWHEALFAAGEAVREALKEHGPSSIAFIGGARLTNEDAFAFVKLAKSVIGTDSTDAQLGDGLPAELVLGLPRATINEATNARVVIVLNQDLREELPVLFLRLRGSVVDGSTDLIDCSSVPTSLSKYATTVRYVPGDLARVAALIAGESNIDAFGLDQGQIESAKTVLSSAGLGADGEGLVIVCGRGDLGESASVAVSAAVTLHRLFPKARFLSALRRSNVHGALDMGLAPGVLPGRVTLEEGGEALVRTWGSVPNERGSDAIGTLESGAQGKIKVLFTLGADVLADVPDRDLAARAFAKIPTVISIATHHDRTTAAASVVLPVAGEGERNGTVTNIEGRVAPTTQKIVPPGVAWPAWMVASEIARMIGSDLGFEDHSAITQEIAAVAPAYHGVNLSLANGDARRAGVVVPVGAVAIDIRSPLLDPIATPGISSVEEQGAPMRLGKTVAAVPSGDARPTTPGGLQVLVRALGAAPVVTAPKPDSYSYRLSVRRTLYDRGTLVQSSSSLAPHHAPFGLRVHPLELARLGVSDGEELMIRSPRLAHRVNVISDASLGRQVVVLGARNEDSGAFGAFDLIDARELVVDVRLESI
ncbi:MAG TPA: NADH-quinone oxidoreductase subunit NuoG [Acidimicrobiales bacterium]|nr:NADH-quinone oxidoreductase subunit NuoG [Acidimicrobiales bacterium]